jgi:hypothetical protein
MPQLLDKVSSSDQADRHDLFSSEIHENGFAAVAGAYDKGVEYVEDGRGCYMTYT